MFHLLLLRLKSIEKFISYLSKKKKNKYELSLSFFDIIFIIQNKKITHTQEWRSSIQQ